MTKHNKKNQLPTTAEAEKWLDADTFKVDGKVYKVSPKGIVSEKPNCGNTVSKTREANK